MSEEKSLAVQGIQKPAVFSFEAIKDSVQELDKFYKTLMQKGTDYDTIPGTPKPTLLKSGAELLRLRFGYNPQFKISKGATNIENGFIEYDITCSLYDGDLLVAEGVGNANSLESKWRYRWLDERDLPKGVVKDTLVTKWVKNKTGGSYPKYRFDNENPQDLANTVLKIAKKRAFVDAILTATGASRIFTQDIEDMEMPIDEDAEAPIENEKCPIHNVAWQHGKFGDYHWTDQKDSKGKNIACNRSKVEKAQETVVPTKDIKVEDITPPATSQSDFNLEDVLACDWSTFNRKDFEDALIKLVQFKKIDPKDASKMLKEKGIDNMTLIPIAKRNEIIKLFAGVK